MLGTIAYYALEINARFNMKIVKCAIPVLLSSYNDDLLGQFEKDCIENENVNKNV